MAEIVKNPRGHALFVGDAEGFPFLCCAKCGAWAASKPRALALPCSGRRTLAGKAALKAVGAGWAPCDGRGRKRRLCDLWHGAQRSGTPVFDALGTCSGGGSPPAALDPPGAPVRASHEQVEDPFGFDFLGVDEQA